MAKGMLKAPQDEWEWAKTARVFPTDFWKDAYLYGIQTSTDRYKFPRIIKNSNQRF